MRPITTDVIPPDAAPNVVVTATLAASRAYKSGDKELGAAYYMKQYTMKILLNSLYGATALGSFRYGNVILSEAITLSGQRIIQESALAANRHMNKVIKKGLKL